MSDDQDRLREHPATRLAGPARKIDLDEKFEELLAEPHEPTDGHRQITISHHGPSTITLIHFQEGSHLREHSVDGPVSIQVLSGELHVNAAGETHELTAHQILSLAPDIEHSVEAIEESRMMLTVTLEHPTHGQARKKK